MTPPKPATVRRRLVADALNRAARTLYQLVVVSLVVDVGPVVMDALDGGDPINWRGLAKAGVRSVLGALLAYAMRRYGDASPVPTPTPPSTT